MRINGKSNRPVSDDYFLRSGYIFVATKPTAVSTVLGSSVSVCIHDQKRKVGGMNHFQLPYIREKHIATAKYGNVAIITLIRMMLHDGSKIKNLEAQILGGAYNPSISEKNIGHENIIVAKKILAKERIRIVSEDVGGGKGRKIVFNTHTSEIASLKVDKLRKSDWYPYEDDR
jgi:chemotaxis protein CheD